MAAHTPLPDPPQWNRYPKDLVRSYKSKKALNIYHDRLAREENEIFVSDGKPQFVVLWDQAENENDFELEREISSQDQLKQAVGGISDPGCRFIFLHTESSRGKLCCTRDQLNQILSHHQVMPSFLDFCFEFKNKEKPTTTTMFRFEDYLVKSSYTPRIQHAFNIIAPEEDRRHRNPWLIRHTTVYHSFDLAQAKSVWVVVKANRLIRDRITSSGDSLYLKSAGTEQSQAVAQFVFSLSTHLQILEWCTEGWNGYIDSLEEKVRKHSASIKLAPVEALSRKPPKSPIRAGGRGLRATGTGFSRYSSPGRQPLRVGGRIRSSLSRITSGLSGLSHKTLVSAEGHIIDTISRKIDEEDEEQLDSVFKYDDLQRIRQVTDEAEEAGMIIKENLRIIATLQERYQDLIRSWNNFGGSCKIDRDSFETLIVDFCRQLSVFQNDLDSYEARVQLLLRNLTRNEQMFQGILQYGNMRVGEYYARSADTSTKAMEEWTVSMHGITVLTLIFLPATFVSTLFSSGILSFDGSKTHRMGDWETRMPALKLFLAICIPLMAVAFTFWWVTYRRARGRHNIVSSGWFPESTRSEKVVPAAMGSGAGAGAEGRV